MSKSTHVTTAGRCADTLIVNPARHTTLSTFNSPQPLALLSTDPLCTAFFSPPHVDQSFGYFMYGASVRLAGAGVLRP